MASLPPLRARAVTRVFSECDGIDDAVRRISQQPEENCGGCHGARRLSRICERRSFSMECGAGGAICSLAATVLGSEDYCSANGHVRIHHCRTCVAIIAAENAQVRLSVYRYCKCAPPAITGHRRGSAFALRILGRLQCASCAGLQSNVPIVVQVTCRRSFANARVSGSAGSG